MPLLTATPTATPTAGLAVAAPDAPPAAAATSSPPRRQPPSPNGRSGSKASSERIGGDRRVTAALPTAPSPAQRSPTSRPCRRDTLSPYRTHAGYPALRRVRP